MELRFIYLFKMELRSFRQNFIKFDGYFPAFFPEAFKKSVNTDLLIINKYSKTRITFPQKVSFRKIYQTNSLREIIHIYIYSNHSLSWKLL